MPPAARAGFALLNFMIVTKTKIALAAITAGLMVAVVIQSQENAHLQRELRQETAQLEALRAENERLSQPVAAAAPALNQDQLRELARLRGEVGGLKDKLKKAQQSAEKKVNTAKMPAAEAPADAAEEQRKMAIAKMDFAKQWVLAFWNYAEEHNKVFPGNFDQAAAYFPIDEATNGLGTNQFQVLYKGSFNQITNPAETIVLGEIEATRGPMEVG